MSNPFLAAAYAFVWVVFIFYAWNLARRRARVSEELEDLKKQARELLPSDAPSE